MPPTQRWTEDLAGFVLQKTLSLPADALAGPRGFSQAGAAELATYPSGEKGMNNWIYLYDVPLAARNKSLAVGGVALGFKYEESIVKDETDNRIYDRKRFEQFRLQLSYLLQENYVRQANQRPTEVEPSRMRQALHIASFTLEQISDINPDTPESVFVGRIRTVEKEMQQAYGYEPAVEPPVY